MHVCTQRQFYMEILQVFTDPKPIDRVPRLQIWEGKKSRELKSEI